ncbi:hypothetical protein HELRODRAFT_89615 [Helobdella robusta]|uniref:Protein YIPF n=1 Tax=Helobdella robusta TaxID=6412 RepID=T1G7E9_HELRO|nr:hypothetical protein HELRODRAFT_89615 [Helobdella robusta]ESN92335.1 hypothetical protein HELRODRAFT_89615 [Helobdella robusta]
MYVRTYIHTYIQPPSLSSFYDQTHLLIDEPLEGEINVPLSPTSSGRGRHDRLNNIETTADVENGNINLDDFNTLDEPVRATITRDLKAVGKKFMHVLYPRESRSLLKDWDLWGPLMLCICLAVILHEDTTSATSLSFDSSGPQFAEVFIVYWIGAAIVTLNIKLLGGSISIFQGVCVLGYCVLPLAVAALACSLLLVAGDNTFIFVVRCIFVFASLVWSVFASTAFLANCQPPRRKLLAVYPIFLFYFFLSWIVLLNK